MKDFTGNTARLGLPLAVTCVAQFVVVLDVTIVTTALPVIRSSFGSSASSLQWIITGYTLAFGGLLITGGRLADLIGPRRTFLLGLVMFTTASGACALACCQATLIGARVVQGVGSALLSPAALALLSAISSPGAARRRAVGWWTAAAATGGASGWLLGGVLTEYLSWRAVFWVNLPIGIATSLVAMPVLPAAHRTSGRRLDLLGSIAVTGALALLVYGLTRLPSSSATSPASWIPILMAAVGLGLVVRHERRITDPLLPPGLFRSRPAAGANLTALLITATTTPAMYLATLYVQQQLHLGPARASLLFPVFNIAVIGGSTLGPYLLRRLDARPTLVSGFVGIATGAMVLTTLHGTDGATAKLLASFALMGLGLGAASVASTHTGTEAVDHVDRGAAAGVLTAAAQMGTAIGLALITPLAASGATVGGYRLGFTGVVLLATAGVLLSLLIPGRVNWARKDRGRALRASKIGQSATSNAVVSSEGRVTTGRAGNRP